MRKTAWLSCPMQDFTEPGVNRLVRAAYHLLDLQVFFTAGPKEVQGLDHHPGYDSPAGRRGHPQRP